MANCRFHRKKSGVSKRRWEGKDGVQSLENHRKLHGKLTHCSKWFVENHGTVSIAIGRRIGILRGDIGNQ